MAQLLTDTQVQVLAAINDHCEALGELGLDHVAEPLPALLAGLELIDQEVYTAVKDLFALGLIEGVEIAERDYPVKVLGLTALGRQELP